MVNAFDTIRDQERCENLILEQIKNISPRTYKESSELVHFVSSNAIPMAPSPLVGLVEAVQGAPAVAAAATMIPATTPRARARIRRRLKTSRPSNSPFVGSFWRSGRGPSLRQRKRTS